MSEHPTIQYRGRRFNPFTIEALSLDVVVILTMLGFYYG